MPGVKICSDINVSTIICDPAKKQAAIHEYWADEFLARPTAYAAQSALLELHTVAGGMALMMNPFLTAQAPPEQRGFVKHRQFTDNIVELDAHMGDPLSSTFFVLGTDPLVLGLRAAVLTTCTFRTCADDDGIPLWDIRAMIPVHSLYILGKRATCLDEKLKKCSMTQNILEHNTRIQTVLSYKLQFVDPPCILVNRVAAAHRVSHPMKEHVLQGGHPHEVLRSAVSTARRARAELPDWCVRKRWEARTLVDWMLARWGLAALCAGEGVLEVGGDPGFLATELLGAGVPVTVVDPAFGASGDPTGRDLCLSGRSK
ncbi:unnamed protein product [Prorocentrum cordatum]|uniref:Uncharacterized protein n=1 Tax=Prorocentrum cordatum TaxID=2364126 RepID=A0ABN9T9E5_9DINO|nr:unnamed protein product [Polarella glacialis]